MKKLMFSTAAIVMALSFNAFAGTPEKAEAKPATETKTSTSAGALHWFVVPASGTPVFQNTATVLDEEAMSGCSTTPTQIPCESGYRDDQLNTPGNPSSGIKTDQISNPDQKIYNQDN